ncbi:MAG: TonB-dependent receptor plug domain-containing protein [Cytophagaceae bacterium]
MKKSVLRGNYLLLLLFMISTGLFAQTGNLKGVVKDETGQPAFDVTVFIPALKIGTVTELEGEYEIKNIPPGTYRILFKGAEYKLDTAFGVVIKAGETTVLDKSIFSEGAIVIEITDIKDQGSITTQIEDVKTSDKTMSATSGAQIRQGQDRDAAEAVRRIPGVTLVDNRFIMVRGLGERYNSVWLNDAGAPSSEPDRKSFSFDVIPSQLIDKIQVYKTPAPDLPGDFAGGMVKLYTRSSPQGRNLNINMQGSYRPGSTFSDFKFTSTGSSNFLGYDNGYRALPKGTPDFINKNQSDIIDVSKNFKNTWGIHNRKALPDFRLNVYYTNKFKIFKKDLGYTANLNYANLNTVFKIRRQDWDGTEPTLDNTDMQSTNTARVGIIQNFSYIFNGRHKLEFRNLWNQIGRDQVTVRRGNLETEQDRLAYALAYQSRRVITSQLSGTHSDSARTRDYTWTIGYANSNRIDPDLRRIQYRKDRTLPDSMFTAQVQAGTPDPVNGGGRFFSTLKEKTYSFNHAFKQKLRIRTYKFDLNLGNYLEYKDRTFSARVIGYILSPTAPNGIQLRRLPIDQIFSPDNIGQKAFKLAEITNLSDKYTAQNRLIASYASFNLPFGKRIKLLTGVRHEYNIQSLQSYVNTTQVRPDVKTSFFLPSANLSYSFKTKDSTKTALMRAAYGKTVNRPEFREWSPFAFYDFEFNAQTYGSLFPTVINQDPSNPNVGKILKVCQIHNFDLRYELYPSPSEMFHVGVFYKKFYNPIQQVILFSGGSDSRTFTFTNADNAYSAGIELDVRKNLGFADSLFKTKFLSKLSFVANASLIKSQVTISQVINQSTNFALPGQSPYVINTGLYYMTPNDSTGFQATLLYNVFGPRIFLVGTLDYPNIGEMPRNTVDLNVTKNFSKKFAVFGGIQDLFNQPVLLMQDTNKNGKFERHGDDEPIMTFRRGSYFTLGMRINL